VRASALARARYLALRRRALTDRAYFDCRAHTKPTHTRYAPF
jgi:hypothetical protein